MTDKTPQRLMTVHMKGVYSRPGLGGGLGLSVGSWLPVGVTLSGDVLTALTDGAGTTITDTDSDAFADALVSLRTIPYNMLFNGTTWDRERSNTEETYLASAARTATNNSADFTNYNARGLHAIVNVSAVTGAASITPIIQGKDPVSGLYYDILAGLPITTVGTNVIKVYPGISAVLNAAAADILPRTYRLRVTHGTADSITYSVSGALVL